MITPSHPVLIYKFHTMVNLKAHVPRNSPTGDSFLHDNSVICSASQLEEPSFLKSLLSLSPSFLSPPGWCSHHPAPGPPQQDPAGFPFYASLYSPAFCLLLSSYRFSPPTSLAKPCKGDLATPLFSHVLPTPWTLGPALIFVFPLALLCLLFPLLL